MRSPTVQIANWEGSVDMLSVVRLLSRDLNGLEEWSDSDLVKVNKTECQPLTLGQRDPCDGTGLGWRGWEHPCGKGPGTWCLNRQR